jgi:hypothetical protein
MRQMMNFYQAGQADKAGVWKRGQYLKNYPKIRIHLPLQAPTEIYKG